MIWESARFQIVSSYSFRWKYASINRKYFLLNICNNCQLRPKSRAVFRFNCSYLFLNPMAQSNPWTRSRILLWTIELYRIKILWKISICMCAVTIPQTKRKTDLPWIKWLFWFILNWWSRSPAGARLRSARCENRFLSALIIIIGYCFAISGIITAFYAAQLQQHCNEIPARSFIIIFHEPKLL